MALRDRLRVLAWTANEFMDDSEAEYPSRVLDIRGEQEFGGGSISGIAEPDRLVFRGFDNTLGGTVRSAPVESRSYVVRPFDRAVFEGKEAVLVVAIPAEGSAWHVDEIVPLSRRFWRIYLTSMPEYAGRVHRIASRATVTLDAGLTGSISATGS